ncbi:MAG: hypothetical protein DDT41_00676 [candidate division WS2 bacterium]|nr:hypothetical protein [Candidatus Psychracetigena formicireducens]
MAIAKMLKVRGGVLKKDHSLLLEYLGNAGLIELTTFPIEPSTLKIESNPSITLRQVEEILSYYQTEKSNGMLSGLIEKPSIEENDFFSIENTLKFELIYLHFKDLKTEEGSYKKEKDRVIKELINIKPLKNLSLTPDDLQDSRNFSFKLGFLSHNDFANLSKTMDKSDYWPIFALNSLQETSESIMVEIAYCKEYSKQILPILSEHGFKEYIPEFPANISNLSFSEIYSTLLTEQDKINNRLTELEKEKVAFKNYLTNLQIYHDYLITQINRIENLEKMGGTRNCLLFEGWVKSSDLKKLQQEFNTHFPYGYLESSSPTTEDNPPVILQNHPIIKPYEIITRFFGLPNYRGIDPTPVLALPFTLFFSINMGDAGYGILLFLSAFIMSRRVKLNKDARGFITLAYFLSVTTFLVGSLTWTWFGKSPFLDNTGKIFQVLPLINPWDADGLMNAIILVMIIGIVTQYWGIINRFIHNYRKGDIKSAFLDQGVWLLLLSSLLFLTMTMFFPGLAYFKSISIYILLVSLLLTVLTQGRDSKTWAGKIIIGLISLYGFVGYYGLASFLQDVLSYTRLIALNLTSSGVAMVLNNIVGMLATGFGWILVPFLWIAFHLFNLAMVLLGAFIHAFRLQAIELFGRFYEGGGIAFNPLDLRTNYVKVNKKNKDIFKEVK